MKPSIYTSGLSFIKSCILFVLIGFSVSVNAQTYDEIGVNTTVDYDFGPIYRPSATTTQNYTNFAYLYLSTELNIPSGSIIYRIDWHAQTGTNGLLDTNLFRIDMANTTQSTISVPSNSWNAEVSGATMVYYDSGYSLAPGGGWISHSFSSPFTYTGGNLKILTDFIKNGTATGLINYHYETKTGLAAGISGTSSARGTNFTALRSNGRPDIRIYYLSAGQGTDVGISNISAPLSGALQGQSTPVKIRVANYAGNTVTDLTLQYQLDNNAVVSETWTGNLAPGAYMDYTFTTNVTMPNFHRASIKTWVNSVNLNGSDDDQLNDTATRNICLPLAGNYSIGSDPSDDFPSILAAVDAMDCGKGITGPVRFLVKEGVYTDRIVINPIPGSSAINTVTFKGEKPSTSIIEYSSTVSAERAAITLNGAKYIIIDSLGIDASGSTYGWAIHLTGGVEHIVIKNNTIKLDTVNTGTNYNGIIATTSATSETSATSLDDLLIQNNTIYGGNHSVRLYGSSTNSITNVIIRNNRFSSNYDYGIYMAYNVAPIIESNIINVRFVAPSSTTSAGIYFSNVNGTFSIVKNRITNAGQYGIYFTGCTGISGSPSKIVNNMIGGGFRGTTNTASGIYMTGTTSSPSSYIDIYYNSINMDNGIGSALNIRSANVNNLRVMNNSLAYTATGAGYAMYLTSTANVSQLNYNNYYSTGTKFVYYAADKANLTTLRAVNSPAGNDVNSIAASPGYATPNDLRTIVVNLVDKGIPIAGIATDFYGELRSVTTPVIGAHEFVPLPFDAGVTALVNPTIACNSSNAATILVNIFNFGTEVLTSIPLSYQVNGGTPVQETLAGSFNPNSSTQYSFTTTANLTGTGPFTIKVWTSLLGDGKKTNDTITRVIQKGLAGPVYTIGGTSPNYATINAAVDALKTQGICGPVRFEIRPGTYTERVVIPAILGASSINKISFVGAGTSSTIIANSTTVSTDRAAIVLDGAQHIIIDSLSINTTGSTYGWGIHLTNASRNNIIRNNKIILNSTTTSSNNSGIIASISPTATTGGDAAHYTLIENNEIDGGYTAIGLYGTTTVRLEGLEVRNNRISNYYYYGIYLSNVSAPKIESNTVEHRLIDGSIYATGIYMSGPGPFVINQNRVINGGQNGIMVTTSPISGAVRSSLSNNMVGGNFTSTSNLASGIRILSSSEVDVFHNSVNMGGLEGAGLALISSCTNMDVRNNIFAFNGTGNGFAARFESPGSLTRNNYNNYYSNSPNFLLYGSPVADLATLKAINSPVGNDLNSLSVNPYFTSSTDLRLTRINLNGKGISLPSITTDIYGTNRSLSAPTIGAHEFVPLVKDAGISALIAPSTTCGLTNSEDVSVQIINYGSSVLTSIPVSYRLAGGAVIQETATVNMAINDLSNYTFTIPVSLVGNGPFYFDIWTELSGDMLADNDTLHAVVYKTLAGTYTIGATGDFPNFTNASEVLSVAGVCGPVVFEIQAGTYNERVVIASIAGVSATNTITFKGLDPVNTILSHSSTVSNERTAFTIKETQYITLDSFTIDVMPQTSGTTYGWGVQLMNNASHTTIRNMIIKCDTLSSSGNYQPIVISKDSTSISYGVQNTDDILIEKNTLIGGYYSISTYGLTSTSTPAMPKPTGFLKDLRILNNEMYNAYYYGLYVNYSNAARIEQNKVVMRNGTQFQYAIYLYESAGSFRISRNHISNSSAYGVIVWYAAAPANDPAYIDNNMIGGGFRQNNNAATSGIRLFASSTTPTENIRIVHNSVIFDANAGAAFQLSSSTAGISNIELENNIFYASGNSNAYSINVSAAGATSISKLNNNNYFSNGVNLAMHNSVAVQNLTDLQAINLPSGNDTNSLNIKPAFRSDIDLRLISPDFYQKGKAISSVPIDFFGRSRDISAPTIGAEEFIPLDNDIKVESILTPGQFDCGDSNNVITIVVRNLGLNTQTTIPAKVDLSGSQSGSFSEVIPGPLAFGETDTFTFSNSFNLINGGQVNIEVYTELPSDENLKNDSIKITSVINPKGLNPIVQNDTICALSNAVLIANAANGNRLWFEAENSTIPFLSNSDTLKLSNLASNESYFVENVSISPIIYHVGPVDNSIGTTSTAFFSDAEIFDAYTNIHIDSVKLVVDVAGNITMGLLDAAGNLIATRTTAVTQGTRNYYLGFFVPAGSGYRLSMRSGSTGVKLFRNTAGATYPYAVPGLMSVTGTTNTNQAYFYFFYDLQVRSYCASQRIEVKAIVADLPTAINIAPVADFQGTYAAGGVDNIDHACAGDTLVYVLEAPFPYSQSEFGDRWDISSLQVQTANGIAIGNPSFTPPINGDKAGLTILTSAFDGDSIFILTLNYDLADGCSSSLTRYIYVSPKPQASFIISDICDGDSLRITNATFMQGNPQIAYTWDFGDASSSQDVDPVHVYSTVGTFDISLVATAQVGCPDTIRKSITVFEKPSAAYLVPDSSCSSTELIFDNTSSALPAANFSWNFNDGNISSDKSPSHSFQTAGSYEVQLKVTQNVCADSISKIVKVLPSPVAMFSAYNTCLGDSILFTNQSTLSMGTIDYSWDFGDLTSSNLKNPYNNYQMAGIYDVQLIAISNFLCSDTTTLAFQVYDLPVASFATQYKDNGLVAFTANESGLFAYVWNFGDGATGGGESISHKYVANGSYPVSLKVTSTEGCIDSSAQTVQTNNVSVDALKSKLKFEAYPNPYSDITAIKYELNSNAEVNLSIYDVSGKLIKSIIETSQMASSYSYTFGGEELTGVYIVKLTVDGQSQTLRIVKLR